MAVAPRGPDIIPQTSIPLSATSDQPVLDAPRPPTDASNDLTDQKAGTPKEITAAELAVAAAARKGDPATADLKEGDGAAKPDAKPDATPEKDAEPPELEFEALDPKLPGYAVREITKHRKIAQAQADAAWRAAQKSVGDEAWTKAMDVARDVVVEAAKKEAGIAAKEARTAKEAAEALRVENEALKAKVPAVEEPKPAEDPRPARDQFDDPDLYDEALVAWGNREGERQAARKAADEKTAAEAAEKKAAGDKVAVANAEFAEKTEASWMAAMETAKEKYPDYEEVTNRTVEEGGPAITNYMAFGMTQVDNGTDVAYHLAHEVEEARRIAELPVPAMQFIEIGRLAERLKTPPRRARAQAAPIEPIDTSSNTADTSEQELDMDAYAAKRNKELLQAKRPFFPPSQVH